MTDILNEIRTYLINKELVSAAECKMNISDQSDELVCLWIYGGYREVLGTSPSIQIKVFSKDAKTAEEKIFAIFKALIADKPIRISDINGKK